MNYIANKVGARPRPNSPLALKIDAIAAQQEQEKRKRADDAGRRARAREVLVLRKRYRQFSDFCASQRVPKLLRDVAAKHGLEPSELMRGDRRQKQARARHEAMYLMRRDCNFSYTKIGRALGGIDHTACIHGIRQHAKRNNEPLPEKAIA